MDNSRVRCPKIPKEKVSSVVSSIVLTMQRQGIQLMSHYSPPRSL